MTTSRPRLPSTDRSGTGSGEADQGPTSAGAVIADVGGDRGALVLYTPTSMAGIEIEISRRGSDVRTHVTVRERRFGARSIFAAFYPSLPSGMYTIWDLQNKEAGAVAVHGGVVTEARANLRTERGGETFVVSIAGTG